MQAKQEPSDPASSPEVMKTLVVGALIWSKGRREGILLPQDVKVACRKIGGLEERGITFFIALTMLASLQHLLRAKAMSC